MSTTLTSQLDITTGSAITLGARYKMSPLTTKVQGRGGATRTVITNCTTVAAQLHTSATLILKYLALELSVGSLAGECALKGNHMANRLQTLLQQFIVYCILCPKCKLPELALSASTSSSSSSKKRDVITKTCSACSYTGVLDWTSKIHATMFQELIKRTAAGSGSNGGDANGTNKDVKQQQFLVHNPVDQTVWASDVSDAAIKQREREEFETLTNANASANKSSQQKDIKDLDAVSALMSFIDDTDKSAAGKAETGKSASQMTMSQMTMSQMETYLYCAWNNGSNRTICRTVSCLCCHL
jgi:translation initiation factor 2 beta subunit (eIF-2beta)/eIF-5